jgi:hypothetical protein
MRRLRIALLPHVFVSGHRQASPRPAYITARELRAAIAANAALMTFAGDDDATRADEPDGAEFARGTPPGHVPASAGDAASPPNVAPRRGHAA